MCWYARWQIILVQRNNCCEYLCYRMYNRSKVTVNEIKYVMQIFFFNFLLKKPSFMAYQAVSIDCLKTLSFLLCSRVQVSLYALIHNQRDPVICRVTTLQTMWNSLTVRGTPGHVKCYTYHNQTSAVVSGGVGMQQCMIWNQNEMHKLSKVKNGCKYAANNNNK